MCCRSAIANLIVAVALLVSVNSASGQNSDQARLEPPAEPERIYESFFREVLTSPQISVVEVQLNGDRRIEMYQPSAQEVIGLNDREMRMLRQAASERLGQIDELARVSVKWRKEAFFQRIESGRVSPELETLLQRVQTEKLRILSGTVETLKSDFGPSRFELLDAFIRSNPAGRRFFPRIGSPTAQTAPRR